MTEEKNYATTFTEHFDHQAREEALYQLWEKAEVFSYAPSSSGQPSEKESFVICMPPPNANGELHLGHSYGYSIMDAFGRFFRAQGRPVLLLPGKDHAGIQTQVVFENRLRAQGIDPSTRSREQLYDDCYAFCMDRAQYMRAQEKQLGLSADWAREFFTLDPRLSDVVFETFVRLWNDGLIYRGRRIVNWSVLSGTAISDVEVERKEVDGTLTYIRYPFVKKPLLPERPLVTLAPESRLLKIDAGRWLVCAAQRIPRGAVLAEQVEAESGQSPHPRLIAVFESEIAKDANVKQLREALKIPEDPPEALELLSQQCARGAGYATVLVIDFDPRDGLVTATTRPETMLGDTALAVHPIDPRYSHVVGMEVEVPLIRRRVKVIADDRVEIGFGAGVVKVTPAHDFLDFDIGETHALEVVQVIGTDGRMTSDAGPYAGLGVKECRSQVVKDLEALGLVEKVEKIKHKVPIAERSKDVIEPLISEQWFVKVDDPKVNLKAKALALLEEGRIEIHPPHFRKEFDHWLKNLRDWNISRQLWWGHRIPVWYRDQGGAREVRVAIERPAGDGWIQETDTFDTWFSSGQWAYSTLQACGELDMHAGKSPHGAFPSQCMVMGRDILFFWACRMLLLTAYRMGEVPWKTIYFTGLIRDEHGQKMSKSKGNGIEPGAIIEKFGADALRLGLLFGTTPGNDVNMGEGKIAGYSKFINKLWNAAKLLEMRALGDPSTVRLAENAAGTEVAAWMAIEIRRMRGHVRHLMQTYQLGAALSELYAFTWDIYCDWYLEMVKVVARDARRKSALEWSARYSFGSLLELLHPFLPFLTEEMYQKLPALRAINGADSSTLAGAKWREDPWTPGFTEVQARVGASHIEQAIEIVKAIRSGKVALGGLGSGVRVALKTDALSSEALELVQELSRVQLVEASEIPPERVVGRAFGRGVVIFDHPDRAGFAGKLSKEAAQLQEQITRLEQRLASDFSARAKPEVVQAEREKLATAKQTYARIADELKVLVS
jgi:valyl-tRNA synthetase